MEDNPTGLAKGWEQAVRKINLLQAALENRPECQYPSRCRHIHPNHRIFRHVFSVCSDRVVLAFRSGETWRMVTLVSLRKQ